MPPMVTIITGDFTHNNAINHNTGKTQAKIATVFFLCLTFQKSIQPTWPNKSENIRVRAANAENKVENNTTKEPNRKKSLAHAP